MTREKYYLPLLILPVTVAERSVIRPIPVLIVREIKMIEIKINVPVRNVKIVTKKGHLEKDCWYKESNNDKHPAELKVNTAGIDSDNSRNKKKKDIF